MLYLIGLGLSTIEDISVSGLNIIKHCDHVFIDSYTSVLTHGVEKVSEFLGKEVKCADREFTEQSTLMISLAKKEKVAFLVVGDPLCATTHTDLIIRAIKEGIPYQVVHNAGIMTAVGCCGIQLYRMGETVSIPLWEKFFHPESFYYKIASNYARGLHTLCLLDIKVKEKSVENLLQNRDIYEPPRFMLCPVAAYQILESGRRIQERIAIQAADSDSEGEILEEKPDCFLDPDCLAVCLARVGTPTQSMLVTTMGVLESYKTGGGEHNPVSESLGGPMHCMIIPGKLHPMEIEFLSARLLSSQSENPNNSEPTGTSPPTLLPPEIDGKTLQERVDAMFAKHQELAERVNSRETFKTLVNRLL